MNKLLDSSVGRESEVVSSLGDCIGIVGGIDRMFEWVCARFFQKSHCQGLLLLVVVVFFCGGDTTEEFSDSEEELGSESSQI